MTTFIEGGVQFTDFNEAWDVYWTSQHGDKPANADSYHDQRKAFFTGAISSINILSFRINELSDKPITIQQQLNTAIMTTLHEAMNHAAIEFGEDNV